MSYTKGQLIHCSAEFQAYIADVLTYVDPDAVFFAYKAPGQDTVTYQYSVDGELKKSEAGKYYVDLDVEVSGRWYYKFYSTGNYQGAQQGSFDVDKDNV